MVKELTSGFDVAVQLPAKVCETIFYMAYDKGWIPDFISESDGTTQTHIYIDRPQLNFAALAGGQNTIEIGFPFTIRLFPEQTETGGLAVVITQAFLHPNEDGSSQIEVQPLALDPNPRYERNYPPELADRIEIPILNKVVAKVANVPISPPLRAGMGFFTFKPFTTPGSSQPPGNTRGHLTVFVNQQNVQADPPADYPGLGWDGTDIRVAIPKENVEAALNQQLGALGLPKPSPVDPSITINQLSIELATNHLRVTGNASKEFGPFEPDISFVVFMGLRVSNGQLEAYVISSQVQLPPWAINLQFLIPVIGTLLVDVIREAADSGIGQAVGGLSQDALPGNIFSDAPFPNTLGFVTVRTKGEVTISTKGLVLPGTATTSEPVREHVQPPYVFGHVINKEFHQPECEYAQMIRRNRQKFINAFDAISRGYNGCAWCNPQFSIPDPGRIQINVKNSNPPTAFDGRISGKRDQSISIGGLTVTPGLGIMTNLASSPEQYWSKIAPGPWTFMISDENGWEATGQVNIPSGSQGTVFITATRGKPNCNSSVGSQPVFP
jgi:hypothetical protein